MTQQDKGEPQAGGINRRNVYSRDLSQTIEFTEEEKKMLRRPNLQPLDEDYFYQQVQQTEAEAQEEKRQSESEVNSVPTIDAGDASIQSVSDTQKKPLAAKVKKKRKMTLIKPTFEEHYDMDSLDEISEYNQYRSDKKSGVFSTLKEMFFGTGQSDENNEDALDDAHYDESVSEGDESLASLTDESETNTSDEQLATDETDYTQADIDAISNRISQHTSTFDEPILTDQAINDFYGQQEIDIDEEDMNEPTFAKDSETSTITSGASWLTIGSVLSRVIGAVYVIPWATWLGAEYTQANVLFTAGYKPYSLFLSIATAGFPSSIAKQMAYYHSRKEYRTADKLFKNSLLVMGITGLVSAALLYLIAPLSAANTSTTNVEGAILVIRSLAPALLILPIMSLLRGYFQGFNDMKPTAISQVLEQFARVGYLLAATYAIMMIYRGEATTAVVHSTFAAFIGALLSLVYLIIEYFRRQPVIKRLIDSSTETTKLDFVASMKIMVVDSIPFILLGSGIIIAQLIDQYSFGQILSATSSLLFSEISEMYGAIGLDVDKLVMIIISLAVALATSVVPSVSKLFATRDIKGSSELVEHIVLLFSIVMIPAALGMAAISNNIYFLFYPNGFAQGPELLVTASISSIVLGAYTVLSTILQSMNFRRLTVRFLLVGLIVKIILQFPAIALFQGHGALISTALGFLISSVLMWVKLDRVLDINYGKLTTELVKVIVASALMAVTAFMWNQTLDGLMGPVGRGLTFVKILLVIIMAVIVYGSVLSVTGSLSILIGDKFKDFQDKMRLM